MKKSFRQVIQNCFATHSQKDSNNSFSKKTVSLANLAALLANQHFARGGEIIRGQRIKIHPACHPLTEIVSPIPVDCLRSTSVYRCHLKPDIQRAYHIAV